MAQLAISTSSPADGDTDVFINTTLDVTFTADVLASSVTSTSVVLIAVATNGVVPATVQLIGTDVIRITSNGILAEDSVYKIRFPGTDVSLSSAYVIKDSAASEALATTLSVTFRTGQRTFIDDTSVDKEAADLSLEGDLNLPIHVKALGNFAVSGSVPFNHKSDIAVNTPIRLNFNKTLDASLLTQEWLDVDFFPILDETAWLASSDSFGGTVPDFSLSVTGATIVVVIFSQYNAQSAPVPGSLAASDV